MHSENTISFYPGPSKIYPQVIEYMKDAVKHGVFSLNHRSGEFCKILEGAVEGIRNKLEVPEGYQVYFLSSATECWEVIAQSFIQNKSFHIYNGAFGEKWYNYTKNLHGENTSFKEFGTSQIPLPYTISIDEDTELIALTHNETSNGTYFPQTFIKELKQKNKDKLVAVDATSSMAGLYLDFNIADIWYASVQKCFGLPTGMAVMICSPQAIERGLEINENKHYNSFVNIHKNGIKNQTTHTPNTMNIYLMKRIMEFVPHILETDQLIKKRAQSWYSFIEKFEKIEPLVKVDRSRSLSVIAVEASKEVLDQTKNLAREQDILLGRGYGKWLNRTFRIANFPAISEHEITILKEFLHKNLT